MRIVQFVMMFVGCLYVDVVVASAQEVKSVVLQGVSIPYETHQDLKNVIAFVVELEQQKKYTTVLPEKPESFALLAMFKKYGLRKTGSSRIGAPIQKDASTKSVSSQRLSSLVDQGARYKKTYGNTDLNISYNNNPNLVATRLALWK